MLPSPSRPQPREAQGNQNNKGHANQRKHGRALIRPVASPAAPAWLSPFYLFRLARDETLPHPNGIIALLRFSIWRWAFHRSLVLDYSHPVFREARMVGRNFLANHARRLDD